LDVSLGIGTTGSHVPYESLMRARAVFTPDAARNGNQVILRACPGRMGSPRFRRRLSSFRRFSNGSLALAFPHRACRDLVSTFLQRSPPSLFTTAACSGLKPAPDRRLRGAHPHLSYSIAPPYVGTFVTHSHKATSTDLALTSPQGSPTMSAVEGTSAVIIVGRCIRHRPCPRARSVGRPQRSESRNSLHDANDPKAKISNS
jgi:hypothetical protein